MPTQHSARVVHLKKSTFDREYLPVHFIIGPIMTELVLEHLVSDGAIPLHDCGLVSHGVIPIISRFGMGTVKFPGDEFVGELSFFYNNQPWSCWLLNIQGDSYKNHSPPLHVGLG